MLCSESATGARRERSDPVRDRQVPIQPEVLDATLQRSSAPHYLDDGWGEQRAGAYSGTQVVSATRAISLWSAPSHGTPVLNSGSATTLGCWPTASPTRPAVISSNIVAAWSLGPSNIDRRVRTGVAT
jgi:hypothetical protein